MKFLAYFFTGFFRVLFAAALLLTPFNLLGKGGQIGRVPSIKDHWHFFCTSKPVGNAQILAMKERVKSIDESSFDSGVLLWESACLWHIFELQVYQKKVAQFEEQGGQGTQPQLVNKTSTEQLKRAQTILSKTYKTAKDKGKGLYYFGHVLALLGDSLAVNMFDELMTKFAKSPFAGDSYLALGEFYFDNNAADKAIREYKRALESKKKPVEVYTKYKLAWAHYLMAKQAKNNKEKEKSIGELTAVIEEANGLDAYRKKLLQDSIKDDTLEILADIGDQENAKRILVKSGQKDVYTSLLERMALKKLQEGDGNGAYKIFSSILKEQPDSPENPRIATYLADIMAQKNSVPQLLKNLKFIETNYMEKKAKWRQKQTEAVLKKTDTDLEKVFFNYATVLHRQGGDTNNAVLTNGAVQLYVSYLKNFPEGKNSYDVNFLYGQLLFNLKRYLPSAALLLGLIKKNPKGKYTKDAAEIMITAAQSAMDGDKTKYELPPPGAAEKPVKIPVVRKIYADSLDVFMKLFPKNENVSAMLYASGSVYYDFGNYEEAKKRYSEYLEKYPKGDYFPEVSDKLKKLEAKEVTKAAKESVSDSEKPSKGAKEKSSDSEKPKSTKKKPSKKKPAEPTPASTETEPESNSEDNSSE